MHFFDGLQTPGNLEIDGDKEKISDEDDVDNSDSEDQESNDRFDNAQI